MIRLKLFVIGIGAARIILPSVSDTMAARRGVIFLGSRVMILLCERQVRLVVVLLFHCCFSQYSIIETIIFSQFASENERKMMGVRCCIGGWGSELAFTSSYRALNSGMMEQLTRKMLISTKEAGTKSTKKRFATSLYTSYTDIYVITFQFIYFSSIRI